MATAKAATEAMLIGFARNSTPMWVEIEQIYAWRAAGGKQVTGKR